MNSIAMQAIPVTELRTKQPAIFEEIKESPILLTRSGYGAGVLVHPEMWNKLIEDVEHYKRMLRIERARREIDTGSFYTAEQVEVMLKADGLLA